MNLLHFDSIFNRFVAFCHKTYFQRLKKVHEIFIRWNSYTCRLFVKILTSINYVTRDFFWMAFVAICAKNPALREIKFLLGIFCPHQTFYSWMATCKFPKCFWILKMCGNFMRSWREGAEIFWRLSWEKLSSNSTCACLGPLFSVWSINLMRKIFFHTFFGNTNT